MYPEDVYGVRPVKVTFVDADGSTRGLRAATFYKTDEAARLTDVVGRNVDVTSFMRTFGDPTNLGTVGVESDTESTSMSRPILSALTLLVSNNVNAETGTLVPEMAFILLSPTST